LKIPEKKFQIQKGMMQVCYALAPCALASVYLFGWRSLAVLAVSLAAGIAVEALFTFRDGKPVTSAVFVTAMIFALSLPPSIPLWACAVGIAFGVGLGKMAFGGFGKNIFNPAMVGRCFIYVSFPVVMTNRWSSPFTSGAGGFASWSAPVDAASGATPLAAIRSGSPPALGDMFLGMTSGSLGETSALLILLGGAWIIWKKVAPWRVTTACLLGALLVSTAGSVLGGPVPPPHLTFLSGSFLFGAAFVVTEPVSAAKTREGQWIYGFTIGALTVLLRAFSNFSAGIMFSVLMMNAFAPLIDRLVKGVKERKAAAPARAAA
jgi:Na+-transporting NADH:ubiquinone oxidoreductase subunit B